MPVNNLNNTIASHPKIFIAYAHILLKRLFIDCLLQNMVVNFLKYVMFLVYLITFYQIVFGGRNTKNGERRKIKQTS